MASWEVRVGIAKEIAESLCYFHTTASTPIFHRDIETANIMLDGNNRAKLTDFGISKSESEDQTHLTTIVIGTSGNLDPEYYQSNQYTEKSNVYSWHCAFRAYYWREADLFQPVTGKQNACILFQPCHEWKHTSRKLSMLGS